MGVRFALILQIRKFSQSFKAMLTEKSVEKVIQEQRQMLCILCGFPYAGKSFIAQQILDKGYFIFVSIDDIFHARGFDWNSNKLSDAIGWESIFDESYQKATAALKEGKSVLYDSTNQTVASRDRLRALAEASGVEAVVLYVKASVETVWRRWEENQRNQQRSVVSRELVQETIDMFEEPTVLENTLIIEN